MTYILTSEDRRKLEEALGKAMFMAKRQLSGNIFEAVDAALSLLAGLQKVQDEDAKRLDWLLPNLHPANFGMDFPGGYEWVGEAEFLAKWRAAIDAAMKETLETKEQ